MRNAFNVNSAVLEKRARIVRTNGRRTSSFVLIAIRSAKSTSIARFVNVSGQTT